MELRVVVDASERVAATRSRKEKTAILAEVLTEAPEPDRAVVVNLLAGAARQGRTGVGWSTLGALEVSPASRSTLTVGDVDTALSELAEITGPGSDQRRRDRLSELLALATPAEQAFLRGVLLGELRQGALTAVVVGAIAAAGSVDLELVRRAHMVGGDLGDVAVAALAGDVEALEGFEITLFVPVLPMLASPGSDLAAAFDGIDEPVADWKVDGVRVQVHRCGGEVRVYSRNLREVTDQVPDVVAAIDRTGPDVILDGEAIVLGAGGRPAPFQVTAGRFGTEGDSGGGSLTTFFFDILFHDGGELVDRPLSERRALLETAAGDAIVPGEAVSGVDEGAEILRAALDAGHEGIMVKDGASTYEAGRRGQAWRKLKPAHTLDLVVLAAEWGSGRRTGWLSNLHLGARDPSGGFVMLGKTFKGLTDQLLEWQTARFLELETRRTARIVHVRPEAVVEIAFDGVQASTRYPGGMALRFARVKGYRHDKGPDDADTIDTVREIFEGRRRPVVPGDA